MGPIHDFLIWAASLSRQRVCQLSVTTKSRMALMELRILVSALVLNYTWSGVPDEPGKWDREMRLRDTVVIQPWNGKCVLDLEARSATMF